MRRSIIRVVALVFVAVFIGIIVIADRGEGDRWWAFLLEIPHGDKLGHLGLVGTLCLLCNLALPWRPLPRPLGFVSTVTLVLFVLLTLEEIAQAFVPSRTCDWFDWLCDLAGLAAGQGLAGVVAWRGSAAGVATTRGEDRGVPLR